MYCSVNLVPVARRRARSRARHRNTWLVAAGLVALVVCTGWGVQHLAHAALDRVRDETHTYIAQHGAVTQRLATADRQRQGLLTELRKVADARRPQVWPARLVDLTEAAPEGVYLTSLAVAPPAKPQAEPSANPAGRHVGRNARPAEPETTEVAPPTQAVQLLGRALTHDALLQFMAALQRVPGFVDVKLVRATQAPFGAGEAISFELACHTLEEQP